MTDTTTTKHTDASPQEVFTKMSDFVKRHWIGVVALVVAILAILYVFTSYSSSYNRSVDYGTTLSGQYQANQLQLDTYVKTITEQVGVAGLKSSQINTVLSNAVRGRYDKTLTAAPAGVATKQTSQNNPLISALVEAYPDLNWSSIYDKIADQVAIGRENFRKVQVEFRDQIRAFERWRSQGPIRHLLISWFVGYPKLDAQIGTHVVHGAAALQQMKLLVSSTETNQAFTSGVQSSLTFTPST